MASRASDSERSEIVENFLDEVQNYLPQIGASLDRLQQVPGDLETIEEAYRCTHTIGGSAALIGFPALSHLARGMEQTFGAVLDAHSSLPTPTLAMLRRSFGRLSRQIDQIRAGGEDPRLVAEDDADRSSWRGGMTGQLGAPAGGPGGGPSGIAAGPAAGPGGSAPGWLSAFGPFAQPQPDGSASRWQSPAAAPNGAAGQPEPSMDEMLRSFQAGNAEALATADTAVVPQWRTNGGGNGANGNGNGARIGAPMAELRTDADAAARQIAALRDGIARLREAAQSAENERVELRAFLDGSQDALGRLEEWAGRQMGLDLAGSPESVRRYLPLSVIWVTTTRLKRLTGLLQTTGRDLASSEEQIDTTLRELRAALETAATLTTGGASLPGPWTSLAGAPRPAVPAAEPERALAPAARAELERQVREELRRSLEEQVRDEIAATVRREAEARLRHELEIEVRRQFLSQLPGRAGLDETGGLSISGSGHHPMPQLPIVEHGPRVVQVTGEQSAESQQVFREEALEHLQTITNGIAKLERAPGDVEALRSVRRAMHTLKGAAGMMGFTQIQTLAHASEDLLDRLADRAVRFSPAVMRLILDTSEALDRLVSGKVARPEDQQKLVKNLTDRYSGLTGSPVLDPPPAPTLAPAVVARAVTAGAPAAGSDADLVVRLQLSKLDDLVNLFGELLVSRATLEERVNRISSLVSDAVLAGDRLRDLGGQLETQFEAAALPSGRQVPAPANQGPANQGPGPLQTTGRPTGTGSGGWRPFGRGGRGAHSRDFDELEMDRYTEFHRLSRGLSESVADVATLGQELESLVREVQGSLARENRLSSDFQDRLLKARLVPLQSLVSRLYRSARSTAMAENKEVEFFSEGAETEVDRKVVEEVEAPLLHLVRNAVSHGIEPPGERARRHKPRVGKVTIAAYYEGNQVVIEVRDDGAGIDPNAVRATAIARGWIDRNAKLSDKDVMNLIFQPGVTTASSVTEQSGRGVGLDVVRDTVAHLRGTVEVDSQPGKGTTFRMKLPITLQIARAVLVRVGPQTVAMPMAAVEQLGRLDYYQRVPGQSALELRGVRYPVVHLASYLQVPQGRIDDRTPVLLVNTGTQQVALLVDAIVGQQELVRKPLGAHLRDVSGVSGAAVLGNGQVVLILEPHDLFDSRPLQVATLPAPGAASVTSLPPAPQPRGAGSSARDAVISMQPTAPLGMPASSQPGFAASSLPGGQRGTLPPRASVASMPTRVEMPAAVARSYVLVVDDSPSVRRVVSGMFKANGWNVQTARDGVEALDLIAKERPAAVLLDIEMPRMDGYELMATLRSQEQYKTLPLIVLTSRAASKHQQRAMQLGADDYVVKPYQEQELLGTIARLVQSKR